MNNILELIKLVQGTARNESEQVRLLASLAEPPGEDFEAKMKLPVTNDLPAFNLGSGLGSTIAGQDYGVAAPVFGQSGGGEPSLGQLLIGEN